MHSELHVDFDLILRPKLESHGFGRVELRGCIQDEELWRRDHLWFGVSFDWRDQYFAVRLGHLYWFRDVMPRVVVVGDYSSYVSFNPTKEFAKVGLTHTLESIRNSFDVALTKYINYYSLILQNQLDPSNGKYRNEYFSAIGHEVDNIELDKYLA